MLTPCQRKLFEFLKAEIGRSGMVPSLADMAKATGVAISTARATLIRLEKRGFVRRIPHSARALELLKQLPERKTDA